MGLAEWKIWKIPDGSTYETSFLKYYNIAAIRSGFFFKISRPLVDVTISTQTRASISFTRELEIQKLQVVVMAPLINYLWTKKTFVDAILIRE